MSQTSVGLYERFFEEVGKPVNLEAGGRLGPGDPLASDSPRSGLKACASRHGISRPVSICSGKVLDPAAPLASLGEPAPREPIMRLWVISA